MTIIAFPSTLPLALLQKTRTQPAAFTIAQPRRGYGYVEPTGTDTPAFWDATWRMTAAQAQTFRGWFVYGTNRGVDPFTMQIRTEYGLETFECQFMPDGLLPAKQLGSDLWEYTATIMARTLAVPLFDPFLSSVVLLLHAEGTNGSTVFTDSSSYARSVTRVLSNATISTADFKFGTASIKGTGADRLTMNFGAELSGNSWCIECWVKPTSAGSVFDYFGIFRIGGALLNCYIDGTGNGGTGKLIYADGSTRITSPSALTVGSWQHIAISCEAGGVAADVVRMFIGGVLVGSYSGTNVGALPGASAMTIGQAPSGFNGIYGYIDEYRVTVGIPRYTANFTVPGSAFPS